MVANDHLDFFHDRGERETLDRFARDVAPAFR